MGKYHHHLETQNSDFSIPNSTDYQISGTSDSLSLLSEPPDIRNWFSSYEYESPELGLPEEGKVGEEKSTESIVAGVSSNWFVKPKTSTGDYREKAKHESEVLDSDSLSLSSEPPDITRWFSSYVYESLTLDTNLDFEDSSFDESKIKRARYNTVNKKNDFEAATRSHTPAVEKHKSPNNGFVQSNSSVGDNKCVEQYDKEDFVGITGNKMQSVLSSIPPNLISEDVWRRKETYDHDNESTEQVKRSSPEREDPTRKEGDNRKEDYKLLNSNKCPSGNEKFPKRMAFCSKSVDGEHGVPARGSDLGLLHGDSTKKPSFGGSDKENDGKISTGNGFISTKNRSARTNEGFSLKRPMENKSDCPRNSVKDGLVAYKEATLRRKKPLSETTNFSAGGAPEITGKWKCPQKTKPKLGPPLKQLRLEQWINRV